MDKEREAPREAGKILPERQDENGEGHSSEGEDVFKNRQRLPIANVPGIPAE